MHWTRAVNDEWFDLWCVFMSAFFGETIERYRKDMDPAVVAIIERGLVITEIPREGETLAFEVAAARYRRGEA
ncbi:hypothetical protein ACC771_12940, partial [Rhizobium ruizarguesonis]